MCRRIFIIVILFWQLLPIPLSAAMGSRPINDAERRADQLVAPEIEIISQPVKQRSAGAEPIPEAPAPILAQEILPSVGKDASIVAKSIRTIDTQTALRNAGFDPGPLDGKPGEKTKKAIRAFQKANGLAVDGVVGPHTWQKLSAYLPNAEQSVAAEGRKKGKKP